MSHGTSEPQHELSPGDVCDGYRILSLLAAGGMGDVYEAVHDPSGRTVAVKCLKVRHRNKEDARARMKMEAVVLSELQHENLVQVYDAGITDKGMVWFAMERLRGQTLRDLLYRARRLSIPDALHYASEIADGVDAVHEVNVIHRDLKPENVFVTTDNVVKVLDLGTGKFTGYGLNSTDRMRVIGTTAYMSPEQIKGLRVDARADVYALGLILYEMIAGRHALTPEDGTALPQGIEQVALMQLQMTPKALADVAEGCPGYVSAIVDRTISKDRDRRFANMAALSRELRAARKRFVAENQFDGAAEGLREKFGAPPRSTPAPRTRMAAHVAPSKPVATVEAAASSLAPVAMPIARLAPVAAPAAPASAPRRTLATVPHGSPSVARPPADAANWRDTVADVPLPNVNDFPTEIQVPIDFTLDGSTPAPGYVPTILLSSSSVPGLPPGLDTRSDLTDRGLPPDEVRNRTTQTNPIGFVRAAETPLDDSIEIDFGGESWFAFWRQPFVRRAIATLGLGAIIGVPPAILAVFWTRHHVTPWSSILAPSRAPSAPANADPTNVEEASAAGIPERPNAKNTDSASIIGAESSGRLGSLSNDVARGDHLNPTAQSAASAVVGPANSPPIAAENGIVAARPSSHNSIAEAAPLRALRARPKTPPVATASALVADDAVRRADARRTVSPPVVESSPKPVLPPSGL